MTHNFEIWLHNKQQSLNPSAYRLMVDSLKCFKNDIDRPSFLLAYQGMMMQVRHAILHGHRPDGYPEGKWTNLIHNLNQEEGWDTAVFDAIRERSSNKAGVVSPPVINIADAKRDDFLYWRNLRNTCAHYKDELFTKAHTLVLYAFIQQNLFSMTVIGGFEELLQQFKNYFNPALTNPELVPIEPLVDKITWMIPPSEQSKFVSTLLDGLSSSFYILSKREDKVITSLWNHNDALKALVVDYLRAHRPLCIQYLDKHVSRVFDLFHSDEIHELWYNDLPTMDNGCAVLAELITANLIHEREKNTIVNRTLSYKYSYNLSAGELTDAQCRMLQSIGYFDHFMNQYMTPNFTSNYNRLSDLNYKTRFYLTHLSHVDLSNIDNVKLIYGVFSHQRCPYFLVNEYKEYLKLNPVIYEHLIVQLGSLGLSIPEKITLPC